jgi:hypothetical protein
MLTLPFSDTPKMRAAAGQRNETDVTKTCSTLTAGRSDAVINYTCSGLRGGCIWSPTLRTKGADTDS